MLVTRDQKAKIALASKLPPNARLGAASLALPFVSRPLGRSVGPLRNFRKERSSGRPGF
jgi:hypothetical protein